MALDRANYRLIPAKSRDDWHIGLDVGQSIDPSAVCALNHVVKPDPGEWLCDDKARTQKQPFTERFFVRHLERLPLGKPYPEQVQHVANLLQREPLKGATFALDETGCGRPVADLFDRAGLRPQRISITAGNEVTSSGMSHHVPKQFLVSNVESRLHTGELKFAAELTESPVLKEELRDFARKVSESGRVTYNARSGKHDDLILSICIALFVALNRNTVSIEPLNI
jgi:hypothetical protein